MSDHKATLLVLGAGCAAMVGMAVAVFSTDAFFTDPTSIKANAFQVPARVVKTVAISEKPAEKGPSVKTDTEQTASVSPSIRERSALHKASPRWARTDDGTTTAPQREKAIVAAYAEETASARSGENSLSMNDAGDPFAMMMPADEGGEPTVQLAGIVPLVPAPAPREELQKTREPARAQTKETTGTKPLSASATMIEAANMRASARSGSKVLMVVPDGAKVSIAPGCEQWCEISYNGQRGYVYKDFVGSGQAAVAAKPRAKAKEETQTASANPIEKTVYGDSNFLSSGKKAERQADAAQAASVADDKPAEETAAAKKILNEPSMR